jgi:hypothetical protein
MRMNMVIAKEHAKNAADIRDCSFNASGLCCNDDVHDDAKETVNLTLKVPVAMTMNMMMHRTIPSAVAWRLSF